MGPKKMSGRNISYVKPSEPAFLKRLKEQVGFKEGPTIETKKEILPTNEDDKDEDERDDELPVVVVLKPGDLSLEEADELINKLKDNDESESKFKEQKITFKKPEKLAEKRDANDDLNCTSTKKAKQDKKKTKKSDSEVKQIKNKCLLSFDDDDEDDD